MTVSTADLVETDQAADRPLPLTIRAKSPTVDLVEWAAANRESVRSSIREHGAVLFRGFNVDTAERFRDVVEALAGQPMTYRERSSPRSQIRENIYTSTDYPADQRILPHNEHSYAAVFPAKLFFWCEQPARVGGDTPLVDVRRVYARLDKQVVREFVAKGWMYVRNFGEHFGLSWRTAFQTEDRGQVEEYCRRAHIDCEWLGERLRTRQIRPALIEHPERHEPVWFNHIMFFHISSVEPDTRHRLRVEYAEMDLPNNTYYSDGARIPDDVIEHIRHAYESEMVSFQWSRTDLVAIDNVLTAHARSSFVGPRRILFAMAEPYSRPDIGRS